MKRLVASLLVLAGFVLLVCWFWAASPRSSQFVVGRPLPFGKVTPQLVSAWDTAALVAPDGSLWAWGTGGSQFNGQLPKPGAYEQPQRIGRDSDWQKLSANLAHTLAIKTDGSLWLWGNDFVNSGPMGPHPPNLKPKPKQIGKDTDWSDVKVGAGHCIALKKDGSLWGWGQNDHGQVGDGTTSNKFTPTLISADHDWKCIATGDFNSYALKSNGTVWGWGLHFASGGSRGDMLTPVQFDPGTNWTRLSASDYVLLGLKSDGTLWIAGQNAHWAAGYYIKGPVTNFVRLGNDADWQDVYAGQGGFFARKRDGSWWACGQNQEGELGLGIKWPRGTARPLQRIPIDYDPWAFATGYQTTLLLARDGTLWTLGKRLGSDNSSTRHFKKMMNQVISKLPGRWPHFGTLSYITDATPYRLWKLPPEVRRNLGTNSAAK